MSESESSTKTYTLEEVSEHSSLKSLWLVIHNKVYDVTEFIDEHPGGEEVLLEQAGKLSTEAFEDVGHSVDARELMKDYYIGDLCDEDKEAEYSAVLSGPAGGSDTKSTLAWVIPVAISVGIVAIAMYKMMSS